MQLLYVNGVFFSQTFQYGGLVELLTGAKFFYNTGFFEFSLEFFEGAFNVFAFFYLYYDHFVLLLFLLLLNMHTISEVQNYRLFLYPTNKTLFF